MASDIENDEAERLGSEPVAPTPGGTTARRAARVASLGRRMASALAESGTTVDDLYDDLGLPA